MGCTFVLYMKTLGFYIIYAFIWTLALLPLSVLYILSKGIYFLTYYVFSYRRQVVRQNLVKSFPKKDLEEIKKIERNFYKHFCDSFVEWVYPLHASERNMKRRMKIVNPELIEDLYRKEKSVAVALGHYGNWEWLNILPVILPHKIWAIHKPLSNPFFNKFINQLRSKYGVNMVDMKGAFRTFHKEIQSGEKILTYFLTDQSPPEHGLNYFTTFLEQDTPVYLGAEQIARKLGMAVVFFDIRKVKRGYYEIHCELISENPAETAEYEITELHTRALERCIIKEPYPWLWSHRRWKHSRDVGLLRL